MQLGKKFENQANIIVKSRKARRTYIWSIWDEDGGREIEMKLEREIVLTVQSNGLSEQADPELRTEVS